MNKAWPRTIIHIDMDAFFASVEEKDHSEYRGKAIVVGGDPFGRGVVSTASYAARKYGIHSAMPAARARKLCPEALFLKPNFERYQEESGIIMSILRKYSDLVEPASLDEAYLDMTRNKLSIADPLLAASLIKQNIYAATKLTASAGVATNMFLAKVASDMHKPDGLTVIRPEDTAAFLENLSVRKIPGVGPVTEKDLNACGISTCGELATKPLFFLKTHFGKTGIFLYQRARGIDDREVEPHWEPKQYSTEETFSKDLRDISWLESKLREFAKNVFESLREQGRMGRTVTLKVKYYDFEQITRSKTLPRAPSGWEDIYRPAAEMLRKKTQAGRKPIRLLGLGLGGLKTGRESALLEADLFS